MFSANDLDVDITCFLSHKLLSCGLLYGTHDESSLSWYLAL